MPPTTAPRDHPVPALAFLPWATITETLRLGAFHVAPYRDALAAGARVGAGAAGPSSGITPGDREATDAVLAMYRHRRPVDRAAVPVVRRDGRGLLDEPSQADTVALFDLRTRLAFASLAARDLRGDDWRYWNSDALRLVVQAFTHERAGATLISSRTLFGARGTFYTKGTFDRGRPDHVGGCEIPRDLDVPLLDALEAAAAHGGERWARVSDALQLFVRASTDSPDVSPQSELVDLVGVFSRFARDYKAESAVHALRAALPSPAPVDPGRAGPKLARLVGRRAVTDQNTVRLRWLEDAFELRHELAHGKVDAPRRTVWDLREHLLLGAWLAPLLVKAALREAGLYAFTDEDQFRNAAFDRLATLAPFAPASAEPAAAAGQGGLESAAERRGEDPPDDAPDEPDDPTSRGPWAGTLGELRMQFAGEQIQRLWEAQERRSRAQPGWGGWGGVLDDPLPDSRDEPGADDRSAAAPST